MEKTRSKTRSRRLKKAKSKNKDGKSKGDVRKSTRSSRKSFSDLDNAGRRKSGRRKSRKSKKSLKLLPEIDTDWITIDPNDPVAHNTATTFCSELAEEYWTEAEDIFLTRFIHREKNWRMASELRDTWLRIVEFFYMEFNISTQNTALPLSRLNTTVDTPPQPLTHDFWARGTLELFPDTRRESVMDPFIRRKRLGELMTSGGRSESVKSISSMPSWQRALLEEEEDHDEEMEIGDGRGGEGDGSLIAKKKSGSGDKLNYDNETQTEQEEEFEEEFEASNHSLVGGGDAAAVPAPTPLASKLNLSSESSKVLSSGAQEVLVLREAQSSFSVKSSHSGLKPWTISERKMGMEVAFKVFGQTTEEAISERSEITNPTHRSQSESDFDVGRVEILNLDEPGTESLYQKPAQENTDTNPALPESKVPSQSNMVVGESTVSISGVGGEIKQSSSVEVQEDSVKNVTNEQGDEEGAEKLQVTDAISDLSKHELPTIVDNQALQKKMVAKQKSESSLLMKTTERHK